MYKTGLWRLAIAVLAFAAGAAAAQTVRVGSKNFTEQFVLAEIYAQALEASGIKVERKINLGVVNGRRFAFAAGVGADAQAVRLVDGAGRAKGRRPGDAYFAAQIVRTLLRGDFREPQLEVSIEDQVVARGVSVFAANVHPWSYLGPFALKLAPLATFEGGLDVVVPSDMRRRHLPRYATQLLVTGSQARRPDKLLAYLHDVEGVRVSCNRPLPMHADGDDLGDVEEALFGVARNAARILV